MSNNPSKHQPLSPSYHESLDHLLFIPGVGHVAPDTYSGYGSLLDSDVDDNTEATSAFCAELNTIVPDSVIDDVPAYNEKVGIHVDEGRSGSLSPRTKKFNAFCSRSIERERKKEAENKGKVDFVPKEAVDDVDLSPTSKKFKKFCDKYLGKNK
ncbi:uncharacterized protein LOC141594214 [Silene latifolia]|uniref:uncharacterized protein LOC141594214 n=1 Tax=Silene latifolia TaxID=37657 RepID=UPI003D77EA1F